MNTDSFFGARCNPRVLVYVPTYKRPVLLRRAIDSLIAQNFHDWECVVINDAPSDNYPDILISELKDSRIRVVTNSKNQGAVTVFNRIFSPTTVDVEFVSMLEDDNSWEPDFLSILISILDMNQNLSLVWSNMYLVDELHDGRVSSEMGTIWPCNEAGDDISVEVITWPTENGFASAIHSNGSMLMRKGRMENLVVPLCCDFSAVEILRERAFEFPIGFVRRPLATFTRTLQTTRNQDPISWNQMKLLAAGSFIKSARKFRIENRGMNLGSLQTQDRRLAILASIWTMDFWSFLLFFRVSDLLFLVAYHTRHPWRTIHILLAARAKRSTWTYLITHTSDQWSKFVTNPGRTDNRNQTHKTEIS